MDQMESPNEEEKWFNEVKGMDQERKEAGSICDLKPSVEEKRCTFLASAE